MRVRLSEIVNMQFGVSAASKIVGDYVYLQGRDFDVSGEYLGLDPLYVDADEVRNATVLERSDVLFSAKGKIFATVWQNQVDNAVASGTFVVLKIKDRVVDPEYLAIYLNSTKAKKYYDLHIKTATVSHLGKKQLEQMEVEIPSLVKQNLLVQLSKLMKEEKKISNELNSRKEKILNNLI